MFRIRNMIVGSALLVGLAVSPLQAGALEQSNDTEGSQGKTLTSSISTPTSSINTEADQFITRSESAELLGQALSIKPSNKKLPFTDVDVSDESYGYLSELIERGVFAPAEKFNPNAVLTRAQAAKVIVEAFDLTVSSKREFTDVPLAHWAHGYVNVLVANGRVRSQ